MNETRLDNIIDIINEDDRFNAERGDDHYLIRVFTNMPYQFPFWESGWTETPIVMMYDYGVTWEPTRAYPTPRWLLLDPQIHDDAVIAETLKAVTIKYAYNEIGFIIDFVDTTQRPSQNEEDICQYIVDEIMAKRKPKMGTMDKIFAFENGELDEDEVVELFQELVDSKMAWSLQGHYGRLATAMIDRGLIKPSNRKHT